MERNKDQRGFSRPQFRKTRDKMFFENNGRHQRLGPRFRGDSRNRYTDFRNFNNTPHHQNQQCRRRFIKPLPRPVSPVEGSEEYMTRKIQQTSAIIMRHLLTPDDNILALEKSKKKHEDYGNVEGSSKTNDIPVKKNDSISSCSSTAVFKKMKQYNVEEIHDKIMNHITNLNDGRKRNLINSNESGYDAVIQQIQKQKRLEISRALRDMCSMKTQESTDFINSIIPDVGIKIEDLPVDVLEELRNTLNLDFDEHFEGEHITPQHLHAQEPLDNSLLFVNTTLDPQTPLKSTGYFEEAQIKDDFETKENDLFVPNVSSGIHIKQETLENPRKDETSQATTNSIESQKNNETEEVSETNYNTVHIKQEVVDRSNEFEVFSTFTNVDVSQSTSCTKIKEEIIDEEDKVSSFNKAFDESFCPPSESNSNSTLLFENIEHQNLCSGQSFTTSDAINEKSSPEAEIKSKSASEKASAIAFKNVEDSTTQTDMKYFISRSVNTNKLFVSFDMFFKQFTSKDIQQSSTCEILQKISNIDSFIEQFTKHRQTLLKNVARRHKLYSKTTPPMKKKKVKEKGVKSLSQTKKGVAVRNKKSSVKTTKSNKLVKTKSPSISEDKRIIKKRKGSSQAKTTPTKKSKMSVDNKEKSEEQLSVEITIQDIANNFEEEDLKPPEGVKISGRKDSLKCHEMIEEKLEFQKALGNLQFPKINDKVLVVKHTKKEILAATESGKVYFFSINQGVYTHVLNVHDLPVTTLFIQDRSDSPVMYVGSFANNLRIYNLNSKRLMCNLSIGDSIQCMEAKWGYIFMGCRKGSLLRYSVKKDKFEFEERLSSEASILVVRATQEGSRRILLIGSRNCPVVIRDAMSGLYIRHLDNVLSPTVYSLLLENSLVYCGTTNHNILVFSFHEGKLVSTLACSQKAVGCMKIVKNLLFAGCHNGNIYVYNTKSNKYIDTIQGPGGIILALEVFRNQIIVGTMAFHFEAIPIPVHILEQQKQ